MIRSFADKALKQFWLTGRGGGLPVENVKRVRRMLIALDNAAAPSDLNLPGFRFHELKGRRRGTYAATVSGNWRLTFEWKQDSAVSGPIDLRLEDYH